MSGEPSPGIRTQVHAVAPLQHPAEIVVDRWGIPHIRAGSRRDAFVAQGFNAGRGRLWQLDLWRKRGLGRLAADFGPGFLAQDRAARLFLYRGDIAAEWAAYGVPDAREVAEAFVAGLNAWIDHVLAAPDRLPPEFRALGTRPERWEADDVVRIRSHALVRNAPSEAARAQILARLGTEAGLALDLARRSLEPAWTPTIPDGFDPADVPPDLLDVFRLATAAPDFSPERMAASLSDAWRWSKVTDLGAVFAAPEEGSNNWAVAPARTATGRPVLASDPHRAHGLPSLRTIVHLTAPGMDVIGAGEPAQPGISIGHNGQAAFGLTIFPMDQEDLYTYETHPDDPALYRHGDGWERMREVRERIAVRGAPDQEVVLRFTRHGPVLHADAMRRRAFALRSVWFEPGGSAYLGSLAYLGAATPEQFAAALRHWSVPSVNQVYADRDGRIGWFVAGRAPRRPNWDGLLPVPGDGRYEWDGFTAPEDLPRAVDPPRGFVATANEMNLPPDYPAETRRLGFEWSERSRATRIHAVLDGQDRHTLAQSMALQCDTVSIPARRLCRVLAEAGAGAAPGSAASLFAGWDHRLDADSAPAALFEVWWSRHLKPALLDRLAPDAATRALLVPGDNETLIALLERPDARLGTPARDARDALLAATLAQAVETCRALLGPDAGGWRWGALHHGYFPHPLAAILPGEDALRGVGPLPKGGSGSTPMAAGYRLQDFRVITGASFRMVVDVGDWDASRVVNAPGQSGDPASPHYDDLAPLWSRGEYVPLLYSAAAVDAAAALRITLLPASPGPGEVEALASTNSPAGA